MALVCDFYISIFIAHPGRFRVNQRWNISGGNLAELAPVFPLAAEPTALHVYHDDKFLLIRTNQTLVCPTVG